MTDEKDKPQLTEFGKDNSESTKSKDDPWTGDNKVEDAAKKAATSAGSSSGKKKSEEKVVKKDSVAKDSVSEQAISEKTSFEQDVLNRLAFAAVNEQRRTRRWGIFFKSFMVLYALGLLFLYMPKSGTDLSLASCRTL